MKRHNLPSYLLSISIFGLAGAIVFFAMKMSAISAQVPVIVSGLDVTLEKIEPILAEVQQVRQEIPAILEEVRLMRELAKPVLEEVKLVRELVPPVLAEAEKIRKQVPTVLAEAEQIRLSISPILEEARSWRPVLSDAVEEVGKTREALPPALNQAESIVSSMQELGQNAGEGAVTGVVAGILKTPFNVVGNLGKAVLGLSSSEAGKLTSLDEDKILQAINILSSQKELGAKHDWSNPKSGNKGTIRLDAVVEDEDRQCLLFNVNTRIKTQVPVSQEVTLCPNKNAGWEFLE